MAFLVMNVKDGPFKSLELRQAVNYALPYDEIINNVFFGLAQRLPGPAPVGGYLMDTSVAGYQTDVEKAKELAAASGATPVKVDLAFQTARSEHETLALIVKSALQPLGIEVTVKPIQPVAFAEFQYKSTEPFFIDGNLFWVNDPSYYLQWYGSTNDFNQSGLSDPQVDELLEKLQKSTDEATRKQATSDLQRRVLELAPAAWMAQPDIAFAHRDDIDFKPSPLGYIWWPSVTQP
jgi:peptide/nickel transport system substrate-binding protein